ncbi:uncharacterized protein BCR38DRAFT_474437 [Pseudomassariella vexata]|uniref:Uncharacterized protein n=1 Tax=Pseudomassariella vexata TaxID=1141098 RepID=A0A1Y2DX15_9PEZI|nr:uncharacterized protein BCR38DRAFT_474437 [Pseudomassariella vexata]ORY63840.1 hypothetical protein BCR38DRAFT_474437 [Pseudomassariella vexata]
MAVMNGQSECHLKRHVDGDTKSHIASNNLDWMRDPPPAKMTSFQKFVRDFDWAKTALGTMEFWPRELKQMVRFIMADSQPCVLYWGERFIMIYNEASVPFIGSKHPDALGEDASVVFPDFWKYFATIISTQRQTGETASGEASMLLMERYGFLEETYFNWRMVPVIGDDGKVMGSYATQSDLTKDVIRRRRNDCIHYLSQQISSATTMEDLWQGTLNGLMSNETDVPFALVYSIEEQISATSLPSKPNYTCHLEGCLGVERGDDLAKEYLDIQNDLGGFTPSVLEALTKKRIIVVEASECLSSPCGISWKGFGLPSRQFSIVPLKADGEIAACLIIGLNPYRRYNQLYTWFLQVMADVIGPQISKIRLSDEVKRRSELARNATINFQKSEMRLNRFAERCIVGLSLADTDLNIIYANDAWYKISGMSPSNHDCCGLIENVHPEDVPLVEEWLERVRTQKKSGQFQFRIEQPFRRGQMDSDHRTAMCACYADLNEAGEVETVMALLMDISEHKWIEEQLRIRTKELEESEGKWRNYAEHSPLGILRTDGKGQVLFANDAWHSYYGFTPGQVHDPEPWLPLIDPEDRPPVKELLERLRKESGPITVEFRLKDRAYTINDGEQVIENAVWVLATGFSEFKADGTTVDYIDFWVTDISPQKMATKILTEKMEEAIQLKTHQERFIDMISHEIRNPLSAVLHCGEEVVEAMGKCLAVIQEQISDEQTPGLFDTLQRSLDSALDSANTIMYCVQHQKQIVDDVLTLSKLDSNLLVVSPVPIQPIGLVRSSLKMFDHEIKMADISLEIVEDKSLTELCVDWILLDPNRFIQIVLNLVTNAIKFTRPSSTRMIVIVVSASTEPPPGPSLGVDYVPSRYSLAQPPSPMGDPAETLGDIYLSLSVRDSCKGLNSKEKASLFNRFAQASPKTHIEYGGSGLGLFISHHITEMLGGRIGMTSSPGCGCTFAFYVKANKTTAPAKSSATAVSRHSCANMEPAQLQLNTALDLSTTATPPIVLTPKEKPGAGAMTLDLEPVMVKRHVLVVEDNLVNQKVLCKLLRNRGFIVAAANHGREALDALVTPSPPSPNGTQLLIRRFDIVLCDVEMPVMNGLEFATEVRRLEAQGQLQGHVPILGVTANVRGKQVNAALESGMDGVTTKPYKMEDLVAHIDSVCPAKTTDPVIR